MLINRTIHTHWLTAGDINFGDHHIHTASKSHSPEACSTLTINGGGFPEEPKKASERTERTPKGHSPKPAEATRQGTQTNDHHSCHQSSPRKQSSCRQPKRKVWANKVTGLLLVLLYGGSYHQHLSRPEGARRVSYRSRAVVWQKDLFASFSGRFRLLLYAMSTDENRG